MEPSKSKKSTYIAALLSVFVFQLIGSSLIIAGALNDKRNVIFIGLGVVLFAVIVGIILLILLLIFAYKSFLNKNNKEGDK